ncbi:MAG: response regulator [Polyangiaceae bacterium]|nr:response regulator [Polyangiaceae bacterium]
MSVARVLLVDDSDAVLAYGQAALGGIYSITTAKNGVEALEKMRSRPPDIVLLDLSMPGMNGDEVLDHIRADAALSHIPVLIVSSEVSRAEACLQRGADAFLAKPLRADELKTAVAHALEHRERVQRVGALRLLPVRVDALEMAFPLALVRSVVLMAATRKVSGAPFYLAEAIDVRGETLLVFDLAKRLALSHTAPLWDRCLVFVGFDEATVAVVVDRVRDPQEVALGDVVTPDAHAVATCPTLGPALIAVAATTTGPVLVVDPRTLLPERIRSRIGRLVAQVGAET